MKKTMEKNDRRGGTASGHPTRLTAQGIRRRTQFPSLSTILRVFVSLSAAVIRQGYGGGGGLQDRFCKITLDEKTCIATVKFDFFKDVEVESWKIDSVSLSAGRRFNLRNLRKSGSKKQPPNGKLEVAYGYTVLEGSKKITKQRTVSQQIPREHCVIDGASYKSRYLAHDETKQFTFSVGVGNPTPKPNGRDIFRYELVNEDQLSDARSDDSHDESQFESAESADDHDEVVAADAVAGGVIADAVPGGEIAEDSVGELPAFATSASQSEMPPPSLRVNPREILFSECDVTVDLTDTFKFIEKVQVQRYDKHLVVMVTKKVAESGSIKTKRSNSVTLDSGSIKRSNSVHRSASVRLVNGHGLEFVKGKMSRESDDQYKMDDDRRARVIIKLPSANTSSSTTIEAFEEGAPRVEPPLKINQVFLVKKIPNKLRKGNQTIGGCYLDESSPVVLEAAKRLKRRA